MNAHRFELKVPLFARHRCRHMFRNFPADAGFSILHECGWPSFVFDDDQNQTTHTKKCVCECAFSYF